MGSSPIPVNGGEYTAWVDDEDAERIRRFTWHIKKDGPRRYARYGRGKNSLRMHQMVIASWGRKMQIDHIDGDGLNNRKANLRHCTCSQNQMNRRPENGRRFKGYHLNKLLNKWRTQIRVNGKTIHVGLFDDEIAAAQAYDEAATKYFGEFARLNFPKGGPQ